MIHGRVSTHKLKKFIVASIVQPAYVEDIRDILVGRYRWRKISMALFIMALILTSAATVLTFAVAYQNTSWLGLIAGCINVLGGVFSHLSLLTKGESKRLTGQANEILKQLDIDGVPDIETDRVERELQKYEDNNVIGLEDLNHGLREVIIDTNMNDKNE